MATREERLESGLDAYERPARDAAFGALLRMIDEGRFSLPPAGRNVNLHAHSFFSYNAYGFSPSRLAWTARRTGWAAGGIVDFDTLEGVDEFLSAARALGLRACAGIETRVFVPEFADREINSPGEPGIAYHMGMGFTGSEAPGAAAGFISGLKKTAARRNRAILERVNEYLAPLRIDYQRDVVPLTPAGGVTERHLCRALAEKAAVSFAPAELVDFWSDRLGDEAAGMNDPTGLRMQTLIRSKLMKRGGVAYVPPDRGSFPTLADMNRFVLSMGALPTITWLDGCSAGEQALEEWIAVGRASGAAALNIIPDRNHTPGVRDRKLENLYAVVDLARALNFPVFIGTEMNSPGQKLVDDLSVAELAPLAAPARQGAAIACGHTILQAGAGMGYTSAWAQMALPAGADRNAFFAALGERYDPYHPEVFSAASPDMTPERVLRMAGGLSRSSGRVS